MKRFVALLCLFLAAAALSAQEGDPEDYATRIEAARNSENPAEALRLLSEARGLFPEDPRFPILQGDLYEAEGLDSLALDEYLTAEGMLPDDYHILYSIARIYGRLGRELDAVVYLEHLFQTYPGDVDIIMELAWMYYKSHQLGRARTLLTDALRTLGEERNLLLTLGIVHAELYEYDESRANYLAAIDLVLHGASVIGGGRPLSSELRTFASIAYYDLALLEESYHHYPEALDYLLQAILLRDRASPHIAIGELRHARLEFAAARREFEQALAIDDLPLVRMSYAELCLDAGRPDLALDYALRVFHETDSSWMFTFGVNTNLQGLAIHTLLADTYEVLANDLELFPPSGFFARIGAFWERCRLRLLSAYHGWQSRRFGLRLAVENRAYDNIFPSDFHFQEVLDEYPLDAENYLASAEEFETARIPAETANYLLRRGELRNDEGLVHSALAAFDPEWERTDRLEAYRTLIGLVGFQTERRALVSASFAESPPSLYRIGEGLPLILETGAGSAGDDGLLRRQAERALRSGRCAIGSEGEDGFRYRLELVLSDDKTRLDYRLYDTTSETARAGTKRVRSASGGDLYNAVQEVLRDLYSVPGWE